ncbi:MAG: lipopolysaccharide transport periplasmic protein LptA [Desulfovibrio sp.]
MQSRRIAIAAVLILTFCCGLLPALTTPVLAAEAWGEIREATQNLNIREKRDYKSAHVRTLAKGERVKVDFLKDGWYALFPLDASKRDLKAAIGFSKSKYLKFVSKTPASDPKAVVTPATPEEASASPNSGPAPKSVAQPTPSPEPAVTQEAMPTSPTGAQQETSGNGTQEHAVRAAVDSPAVPTASGQGQKVTAKVEQRPEDLPQRPATSGKPPVRITADKLTYDDKRRTVAFSGNVEAVHEELKLWAEELTAFFAKTGKPGEEIDRIVASGGVRMQRGSTEGTSSTVTYMVKENLLLMEGNPVIQDGKNKVTGKVIKFYAKENRSEVVGGNGKRVEAILFAPETLEAP